jgi:AcrR family transcriptional regulator
MTQMTIEQRPRRADAQRNYERILAVTRAAVDAYGGEVVLEDIARDAGVGIGTLYRHFPTRLDLFGAVFRDEAEELRERALELLTAPNAFDALVEWLHLQLQLGAHGHAMGAEVMNAKHTEGSEIQRACSAARDAGALLLERAKQEGAVRDDLDLVDLLRLLHGMLYAIEANPDPNADEREERMFDLIVSGMRR